MNSITTYKLSFFLYTLAFVFGIIMSIVSILQEKYLVFIIALLFAYVGLDNMFCGNHARSCGYKVKGHYTIPPFLMRRKK